jgi:hypothetical protein
MNLSEKMFFSKGNLPLLPEGIRIRHLRYKLSRWSKAAFDLGKKGGHSPLSEVMALST